MISKEERIMRRNYRRIVRREKWMSLAINLTVLWLKGLIVIAEIFAILFAMYWFNTWMMSLSHKNQMRVVWGIFFAFLGLGVPIILGILAGALGASQNVMKRFIKSNQ